jgi:hypothetical protein
MEVMKYLWLASIALVASMTANAGNYVNEPVVFTDITAERVLVQGSMAGARYSANVVEEIGCDITGNAQGTLVKCQATDASGRSLLCTSNSADIINAAQGASAYAFFLFVAAQTGVDEFGDPTYTCTRLTVSTKSFNLPDPANEKGKI